MLDFLYRYKLSAYNGGPYIVRRLSVIPYFFYCFEIENRTGRIFFDIFNGNRERSFAGFCYKIKIRKYYYNRVSVPFETFYRASGDAVSSARNIFQLLFPR